jgi:hypothetical protein
MKKSKKAAKSSAKKTVAQPKKSLASKMKATVKSTANQLLAKMTAKAKKPQVKVPAKAPVKAPAKVAPKGKPVAPVKVAAKPAAPVKSAKPVAPAKAPQGKAPVDLKKNSKTAPVEVAKDSKVAAKGGKAAPQPVVAAVLAKSAKPAKPVKAAKVPSIHSDKMCREANCENQATTKGYCRLDYIKNWKKIKRKEMILKEGKLNQYIEELVSKYPDKYIDVIRQDLSTEISFTKVIHDLELDESIDDLDYDSDSIDALIGGIKKDIDDFSGGGDEEF